MRQPIDKNKYVITFIITAIIFAAMLYINDILDQKRFADTKAIQDQIALDLLSSETQFNLLKETSCKNVNDSILTQELNSLSTKLTNLEANDDGAKSAELVYLKKYYSLLEIKDSILMSQLGEKCADNKPIAVLYFYGAKADCPECENMSYVLTRLRTDYPEVRIYSFDTNLNLSAIDTLKSIYKIDNRKLPAIVYGDDTYTGVKSIDEMKQIIPDLKKLDKKRADAAKASSTSAAGAASGTASAN